MVDKSRGLPLEVLFLPPVGRSRETLWVVDIAVVEDLLHLPLSVRRKLSLVNIEARADGNIDIVALFDPRSGQDQVPGKDGEDCCEREKPAPALRAHGAKRERHDRNCQQQEAPEVGDRDAEGQEDERKDRASRENADGEAGISTGPLRASSAVISLLRRWGCRTWRPGRPAPGNLTRT